LSINHPSLTLPLKGRETVEILGGVIPPPAGVPHLSLGENGVALGGRLGGGESDKVSRALNKLIKKITEDIENFHFNTCVSAFMGFLNEVKDEEVSAESVKAFLKLLYPFAPHISEELNQLVDKWRGRANRQQSLQTESWPKFDSAMIVDATVEIVVQVNGKVKGKVTVPSGSDENSVKELGANLAAVKILLDGQQIRRVVFVKDRLINFVI
jgi:leucyl-tRNA synthetase